MKCYDTVKSEEDTVQKYTVFSVQDTLYCVHRTAWRIQCIMCTVQLGGYKSVVRAAAGCLAH